MFWVEMVVLIRFVLIEKVLVDGMVVVVGIIEVVVFGVCRLVVGLGVLVFVVLFVLVVIVFVVGLGWLYFC